MNYAEVVNSVMHSKNYEPQKRWCGGVYGRVHHRFPIKGGISWREVIVRDQFASNTLLTMLLEKEHGR